MTELEKDNLPKADLYFILHHIKTGVEIPMQVLSICEEYSHIAFSSINEYEKAYYTSKLPGNNGKDTPEEYEIFVVINGVKHKYTGYSRVDIEPDEFLYNFQAKKIEE